MPIIVVEEVMVMVVVKTAQKEKVKPMIILSVPLHVVHDSFFSSSLTSSLSSKTTTTTTTRKIAE
jgi:hypothetical protein